MVEYSLAKAKVEGSSPFFRLEVPVLFNRHEMFVIIGGASRRRDKLLFPLFISHIFCFSDFSFLPFPCRG